jgi:ribosomal protein L7/L12
MTTDNKNLQYVVCFLRNADERIRAIRLVTDATGLKLPEARDFVDNLKWEKPKFEPERDLSAWIPKDQPTPDTKG